MPMLSRVADSLYWMGRYLERAEYMARLLEVTRDLLVDLSQVDREGAAIQWEATVATRANPVQGQRRDARRPGHQRRGHGLQRRGARVARLVRDARAGKRAPGTRG